MSRFSKSGRNNAFFEQRIKKSDDCSLDISKSITNAFKIAKKSGTVNLSSRGIESLPSGIFDEDDGLPTAPINFSFESNDADKYWEALPCQKIDLSFNKIKELPLTIYKLIELNVINIRNNQILCIPKEL